MCTFFTLPTGGNSLPQSPTHVTGSGRDFGIEHPKENVTAKLFYMTGMERFKSFNINMAHTEHSMRAVA